jgi:hypothetical protein
MGNQTRQRLDLATQAAEASSRLLNALADLRDLAERRPYLGNFVDADFTGTELAYLDAGAVGTLFDFVVPDLLTNLADAGNGGRNRQILHQVAKTL